MEEACKTAFDGVMAKAQTKENEGLTNEFDRKGGADGTGGDGKDAGCGEIIAKGHQSGQQRDGGAELEADGGKEEKNEEMKKEEAMGDGRRRRVFQEGWAG